ncbi:leucyl/phenylalanyl-tRNA--protein transferase [Taibaiella sp. KBW10]|uniref:leucyl/phenylalanyl-tRNA--protein transferase n=1 Tax=Taibaiella sp. KBW10 TaxID=2153357 RepID=UPI000F5AF64E|nr:leucyl/phenylalanyl-tRNA--protein transferase [Taibaiella sp. KBW10]RQO32540.1 leucyl/phenylalanyl-tRNA--protein transferase [Taibaiella sp. KBW10]
MILLSKHFTHFPDVTLAEPDGLLAIGGNLEPETLQKAYNNGIFPWYSEGEPICWYAPPARCVIFPEHIKISKSMRPLLRSGRFQLTMDQAFEQVILQCAEIVRLDQDGTWILPEMQAAYLLLHQTGKAHSVEVWEDGELVGGLYGVVVHNVFCGESMFSKRSNASKAALIWLCTQHEYRLIDCQVPNDHLMSLGATMIPRADYTAYLKA